MPNTFDLIASSTVGAGGVSTIDFTSIPQTYTDLILKVSLRDSRSGATVNNVDVLLNNSTSGYSERLVYGNGTTVGYASNSGSTFNQYQYAVSGSATSNTFSNWDIYIPNYTSSKYKCIAYDGVTENNGTTAFGFFNSGLWANTAAVNRITLNPDGAYTFQQYSTVHLYGIKNS